MLKLSFAAVSSVMLISSKWSASMAGMEVSTGTLGSKRRHIRKDTMRKTTQTLADQKGVYAAEKFSDSLCISHVLNLLVESEDQFTHVQSH